MEPINQAQRYIFPWRVLLIGGNSGAGKTSIAREIARRLGVSILFVDDIRMIIQQTTLPGEQPGIHYFLAHPTIWQKPPEEACDGLITVGRALMGPLSVAIAHHVFIESTGPVIIEGDGILPSLAAQQTFPNIHFAPLPVGNQVRSVFLVESDEEVLALNMRQRERGGFGAFPLKEQQTMVRSSWLYGQWVRRQADHYGLPVIESRPWETALARVWQAIS
jgi:2-phosphoglycerate kinase